MSFHPTLKIYRENRWWNGAKTLRDTPSLTTIFIISRDGEG